MPLYHVTLTCGGLTEPEGSVGARVVEASFKERPWHKNVVCRWEGSRLWIEADNDYDENGRALYDEFWDEIFANISFSGSIRIEIVSVTSTQSVQNVNSLSGMDTLSRYAEVEIIELLYEPEHYNGWKNNKRPPAVGDRGVVVERLSDDDYIVECPAPDGTDLWLGDFKRRELRRVDGKA